VHPLPATVVMVPPGVTLRIRMFPRSAMNRFPAASTATATGANNSADVAGPPSPEKPPMPSCAPKPLPATVVMMPLVDTLRTRLFRESAM